MFLTAAVGHSSRTDAHAQTLCAPPLEGTDATIFSIWFMFKYVDNEILCFNKSLCRHIDTPDEQTKKKA